MAIETYGSWKQFWTISNLGFLIEGTPDNQPAKIYANSRNMVEVIITVELLDENGGDLDVTDEEIKEHLYFCHSETGENLASWWLISDIPNEYVNGTSSDSAKSTVSDGKRFVRKYIACSRHERDEITEKVSVGINVPGFGKYDTSRYGTSTKMGSGGIFKSPQYHEITALRPIDYGIPSNIKIECGEFETIESDLPWMSDNGPRDDGECKRRIVYIRPNYNITGQEKFKKHQIGCDAIQNSDVSPTGIGFTVINEGEGFGKPGAVIGNGSHRDTYQVNLWYKRQIRVGINGQFSVGDNNYHYYTFNHDGKSIDENHSDDDENGTATLLLYKLVMPVSIQDVSKQLWENVIRHFTVNVTDIYGNDGSFQLLFNDTDKFDEPGQK